MSSSGFLRTSVALSGALRNSSGLQRQKLFFSSTGTCHFCLRCLRCLRTLIFFLFKKKKERNKSNPCSSCSIRTAPYLLEPGRTPYRPVPHLLLTNTPAHSRTVPYGTVPYRIIPCCTVRYGTVRYGTVPYRTVSFLVSSRTTLLNFGV